MNCRRDALRLTPSVVALACIALHAAAQAQNTSGNVKPPVAQAWIDVATFSGLGMPGLGGAGANPAAMLGSLFGRGGGGTNTFGNTQSFSSGRWVDVTLATRQNPTLAEAEQSVPSGFMNAPLKLVAPREAKPVPTTPDETPQEATYERPRGKLMLYWGCGSTVRAGQPRVLDFATASVSDLGQFFQSRRATQRGAHSAAGRPLWPNPQDARMVPQGASLVGEHGFTGQGVPAGFRFQIPTGQDLMPPLMLQQQKEGGATTLSWGSLPTARGYFVAAMGATRNEEMVLWTSSEVPDSGFGLVDYQTNPAVDRWIGEKVLLPASASRCTVPAGIFPEGQAMLRVIAYGSELNLVHPPRPADPRAPWEPQWAVKVRVKSVTNAVLGMDAPATGPTGEAKPAEEPKEPAQRPKPLDVLRGIIGR